jgi:hypothetical protein
MIQDKYMKQDLKEAAKEQQCAMDLLIKVAVAFYHEDLTLVKQALKDIEKSVNSLDRLQKRRENHKKLVEAAQRLSEDGIIVAVVKRRFH